ncbi:alpha/beta hydrolase family protein [Cryptosporangium phraense]|uniref:S9 family peptidase n=1 Tax=Cryptosporangium phraense TaxID=2593070 RepID=A0A545AT35_9ACTN|nr:S9 family peptidase [Cryptosporangium phraense]TQS44507.1 S9 family peptidase [Cryptosporangium phraense]
MTTGLDWVDASEPVPYAADPAAAPASWGPTLSPSGDAVAYVSDRSGEPRLWTSSVDGGNPVLVETGPEPVEGVRWSPNGEWIAVLIAPGGSDRTEIWVVRPDGTDLHQIGGFGRTNGWFGYWSSDGAWLTVAEADAVGWSAAHLIDPATGWRVTVGEADLRAALDVSRDGDLALVRCGPRSARWLEVVDVASGSFHQLYPADGEGSTDLGRFSPDGTLVFVRTDVGRRLPALVAVPAGTVGTPRVVASRDDAELEYFTLSEDGSVVALLWNVLGGRSEVSILDLRTGDERVLTGLPGDVVGHPVLSTDASTLTLSAEGPSLPPTIWTVEVETGAAKPVTYPPPLPALSIVPELHHFVAHDGLELSGWLYPGTSGAAVIHFHGGPEAQERPVYNPLFRELVSRGITVFAPNVRGSSGFGRDFVNADNLGKRHAGIEDVRSCAQYLLSSGLADSRRLGVFGRSYGGYLTLAALTWFPDLFAVGVDTCGMSDLQTFYERTEPWVAAAAVSKYGHPEDDRELLHDLSPIHRIDQLRAPLLVVHGTNDTNVPLYEAEQVVAALEARNAPVRYLRFEDEGHVILRKPNRVVYVRTVADFLETHLRH